MGTTAVIVDSRNVLGQVAAATGHRDRPTVDGVRNALARLGFDVGPVHVGLALPRSSDAAALSQQGAVNLAYKLAVEASDDAHVLLGELHLKQNRSGSGRRLEEKMVDGACNVRITRYVEEIRHGASDVTSVVVLSKDIDLTPSVQHGMDVGVPVIVAATDVVQHRQHPYVLLPPAILPTLVGKPGTGHEYRNEVARLADCGVGSEWTVHEIAGRPGLCSSDGLRGVGAPGVSLPPAGSTMELHVMDVDFTSQGLEGFPVPVLAPTSGSTQTFIRAEVVGRVAPQTGRLKMPDGAVRGGAVPFGAANQGDTVLVHVASGRVVGRVEQGLNPTAAGYDANDIAVLRVTAALPRGGHIVVDGSGQRGLLLGKSTLQPGDRVPAVPAGRSGKGPVWYRIGTALPSA